VHRPWDCRDPAFVNVCAFRNIRIASVSKRIALITDRRSRWTQLFHEITQPRTAIPDEGHHYTCDGKGEILNVRQHEHRPGGHNELARDLRPTPVLDGIQQRALRQARCPCDTIQLLLLFRPAYSSGPTHRACEIDPSALMVLVGIT
jgi:hypothetical protein